MSHEPPLYTFGHDQFGEPTVVQVTSKQLFVPLESYEFMEHRYQAQVKEAEERALKAAGDGRTDANREMSRMMVEKRLREQIAMEHAQHATNLPVVHNILTRLLAILDTEPPLEFDKPPVYGLNPLPLGFTRDMAPDNSIAVKSTGEIIEPVAANVPVAQGFFHHPYDKTETVGVNIYPKPVG